MYWNSILLFFFPVIILAQSNDLQFDYLGVENGLSNSAATNICQDSSGFIWIGTSNGLNKYDGYRFTVFKHPPFDTAGLSDNFITSLCVDRFGYIWIGTRGGGLNRYDPHKETFLHFQHDPENPESISSNEIMSICPAKNGILWIGTEKYGLNKLINQPDSLDPVHTIFEHYTSPYTFEHSFYKPEKPWHISGTIVNTIFEDSRGFIWIGTYTGLSRLTTSTDNQVQINIYRHNQSDANSLSYNDISRICEDDQGRIWIGTCGGGLNRLDDSNGGFTHFRHIPDDGRSLSHDYITALKPDHTHTQYLWVGTRDSGINRFNLRSEQVERFEKISDYYLHSNNYVYDIFQDASGLFWITGGWSGTGVYKFDPWRNKFNQYDLQYGAGKNEIICSIYINPRSDGSTIWLTSARGGLLKFNRSDHTLKRFLTATSLPVYKDRNMMYIFYGEPKPENPRESMLWLGQHYRGITCFDTETEQFIYHTENSKHILHRITSWVTSIYPDPQQRDIFWIGTGAMGLFRFDRKNSILKQYDHDPNDSSGLSYACVTDIYRDSSERLWISTLGGLNRMNETDGTFVHYRHNPADSSSLSHDWVNFTFESSAGVLWVGTHNGLNKFDPEHNLFVHYGENDGLPDNNISGMLEDRHGNFWLPTANGLARYNTDIAGKHAFRNYDEGDGLPGNELSGKAYFQTEQGEMYIGGLGGFTIFNPDDIHDNSYAPKIVINDFKIHQKSINPGSLSPLKVTISETRQIILDYEQNNLSFTFSALDFLNPPKNRYAYRMDGVDHDWIHTDASHRSASYTQLDPGTYVFRVKGSNNDGLWNQAGTSVKIIVTPPWWRSLWAYIVYILVFGISVFALWNMQVQKIRVKHRLEIEHLHTGKLVEIDRIKSRFFANISHEFRTPLTLILGPVQNLLAKIQETDLKNELKIIFRNATRLERLVNQLLDLSRFEAGKMVLEAELLDIVALLRKNVLAFTSLAERKKIIFNFRCPLKSLETYIDRDKFEKIINNLLSNAFKFTPEGGRVNVTCGFRPLTTTGKRNPGKDLDHDFIEISVTNTGSAIPVDKISHIFDRFYQSDDAYIRTHEGSGIGLSLVKELVELHHGGITVHSRGNGNGARTTFIVKLPLNKEFYSDDEIIDATSSPGADLFKPLHEILDTDTLSEGKIITDRLPDESPKFRILLIEDNADMRTYIRENLKPCYMLIEAMNGRQGIAFTTRKNPDLIISDIMMPEMDGYQVCRMLKSDIRTSHLPIILLTARAEMQDKLKGLEAGADDYIAKPFAIDELLIRVKNLIEQRQILRERFSREALFGVDKISSNRTDEKFLENIRKIIYKHIDDPGFTVQMLSNALGMSRTTLHAKLKALTGMSPHHFIRMLRLKRAAILLREKTASVTEVAYEVGFKSLSHFTKVFREQFSENPSRFSTRHI